MEYFIGLIWHKNITINYIYKMKSLLRIFLLLIGIYSTNQVKAQIITINMYGRAENGTAVNLGKENPDSTVSQTPIREKTLYTDVRPVPVTPKRFYAPLKNMAATSGYGWRRHPVTGQRKFHWGIDLKALYESVYAVADGVIKKAGWGDVEGYYVVMGHGDAETIYCHLSRLFCSPGDTLKGGTALGISGNTGRSTGPHLHFGMRYKSLAVNPLKLLEAIGL
ncbi:murein DD-endopeptidase MepM/ murein hydrolase activator NlpD [Niabella hirudinis]